MGRGTRRTILRRGLVETGYGPSIRIAPLMLMMTEQLTTISKGSDTMSTELTDDEKTIIAYQLVREIEKHDAEITRCIPLSKETNCDAFVEIEYGKARALIEIGLKLDLPDWWEGRFEGHAYQLTRTANFGWPHLYLLPKDGLAWWEC